MTRRRVTQRPIRPSPNREQTAVDGSGTIWKPNTTLSTVAPLYSQIVDETVILFACVNKLLAALFVVKFGCPGGGNGVSSKLVVASGRPPGAKARVVISYCS